MIFPYLPHAVVLHGDFPKEEVDELAVIDGLDEMRLWNQQEQLWAQTSKHEFKS